MARAYYPDGGTFKPFTPEMVGAVGYYQTTMFHTAVLKLDTYQAQSTSSRDGFTIMSTITAGYNGNLSQQLVSILTFRFGNGSGTLYNGWQTSFPIYNTDVEYYYMVSGSQPSNPSAVLWVKP